MHSQSVDLVEEGALLLRELALPVANLPCSEKAERLVCKTNKGDDNDNNNDDDNTDNKNNDNGNYNGKDGGNDIDNDKEDK